MKEGSSESLAVYTYTLQKMLFSMLKMGMEVRFAQNYGWEMRFTPHPLPLSRTLAIVTLPAYFVYNCGGNGCFNNSNRLLHVWNSKRHVQTFIRKLTVQPTTYFPDLENHKLYHVIDTFCFNCNSWSLPSNLVITTSITCSDHVLQLNSVII